MKRIAIETYTCTREYLVEVPKGETNDITGQRVLKRKDGVDEIPNSEKFVSSVSVSIRDLKDNEVNDYVLVRMEQLNETPKVEEIQKKRGRPPKSPLDKSREAGIMDEQADDTTQSKQDLINSLL